MSKTNENPNVIETGGRKSDCAPVSLFRLELRVLEYELGQVTIELAKLCSHIDNIQKHLGHAIPPNTKLTHD